MEYKLQKDSYIKLDHLVLFSNKEIGEAVRLQKRNLDPYLRKIAIKKLVDFIKFDSKDFK